MTKLFFLFTTSNLMQRQVQGCLRWHVIRSKRIQWTIFSDCCRLWLVTSLDCCASQNGVQLCRELTAGHFTSCFWRDSSNTSSNTCQVSYEAQSYELPFLKCTLIKPFSFSLMKNIRIAEKQTCNDWKKQTLNQHCRSREPKSSEQLYL